MLFSAAVVGFELFEVRMKAVSLTTAGTSTLLHS
jgi:hypothetical protein